ncbi:interleukin-10 receptor subunit alpha isoform X2 [Echeneis naucrates]|nr:uncharacterized protein LOC115052645 isoform X2 [Echeneis naucrates]
MYNVKMGKLNGNWTKVENCTGITHTYCDLSGFIHNYNSIYKVGVQLVMGDDASAWKNMKVRPYNSELQPPSFSLLATSSTLSIYIHQKPILRKLFPFGLSYTIYLVERGQQNKTIIAYLRDDLEDNSRTFSSLHWGREYCVSMRVRGNGATTISGFSPTQCLKLPEQEWYIIAVLSLSTLSVLAIIVISAVILLCYLKRPAKTPAALKSPASDWLPLPIGEGPMEVVTDKGWYLFSYRSEVEKCVKDQEAHVTVKDSADKDRRTSMDSGVSMQSSSAIKNGDSQLTRQDDSGCGSSTSSQTVYPLSDEKTDTNTARKREDSGVGLGCRHDSFSISMDEQGSSLLKGSSPGGNYRTQRPWAEQNQSVTICDDEEGFKQTNSDIVLAEVVTSYRAGLQSCICSKMGKCIWCHNQGEVAKQYRTVCIENRPLSNKCDFVDSCKSGLTFSGYSKKSQMNTDVMDDFKNNFSQPWGTFPLLTTVVEGGHDFNMNNVSVSLCDVQLTND